MLHQTFWRTRMGLVVPAGHRRDSQRSGRQFLRILTSEVARIVRWRHNWVSSCWLLLLFWGSLTLQIGGWIEPFGVLVRIQLSQAAVGDAAANRSTRALIIGGWRRSCRHVHIVSLLLRRLGNATHGWLLVGQHVVLRLLGRWQRRHRVGVHHFLLGRSLTWPIVDVASSRFHAHLKRLAANSAIHVVKTEITLTLGLLLAVSKFDN